MRTTPERIAELGKLLALMPEGSELMVIAFREVIDLLADLEEERAENGRLRTEMNRLRLRFPEIVIEEALGLEEPSHE